MQSTSPRFLALLGALCMHSAACGGSETLPEHDGGDAHAPVDGSEPIDDGSADGLPDEHDGAPVDPTRDASTAPKDAGARTDAGKPIEPGIDVTFFVVADTHADPLSSQPGNPATDPNFGNQATVRAIHAVAREGSWPDVVDGVSGFRGGAVGDPRAVVFVGDITGWGVAGTEIPSFRHYYQTGQTADSLRFPGYVGLGNHDVDNADRSGDWAEQNRNGYWQFVRERHQGDAAPVRVTRFDDGSHAYSFDIGGVHFVQVHRFAGDTGYGRPSSLPFLENDLRDHAADGRPVFLFHHYGMDPFGREDRWWNDDQRAAYRGVLADYNVAGIMVGHSHAAFRYDWEGLRVFHTNNAKAEIGTGNNDGNGSFSIVRITDTQLDVVTCRWLDGDGHYEFSGPAYSGPADAH